MVAVPLEKMVVLRQSKASRDKQAVTRQHVEQHDEAKHQRKTTYIHMKVVADSLKELLKHFTRNFRLPVLNNTCRVPCRRGAWSSGHDSSAIVILTPVHHNRRVPEPLQLDPCHQVMHTDVVTRGRRHAGTSRALTRHESNSIENETENIHP